MREDSKLGLICMALFVWLVNIVIGVFTSMILIAAIYNLTDLAGSSGRNWPLGLMLAGAAVPLVAANVILTPTAIRFVRVALRERRRCVKCAYDLRGDSRSGCPECGWGRGQSMRRPSRIADRGVEP